MQNNLMFVAGQQLRTFEVYRKTAKKDAKGHVSYGKEELIGKIKASISVANQKEVEKYKQMGHSISHTLVQQLKTIVKAEDVLLMDGNRYYVKGVDNPAGLNFYAIIHCDCKAGE